MSLLASVFFGYSAINCLVFHGRLRQRIAQYRNQPLEGIVRSTQYNRTLWFSGAIGVIGFAISSWQFVLSALALLHTRG
jgi:hypothetical protein